MNIHSLAFCSSLDCALEFTRLRLEIHSLTRRVCIGTTAELARRACCERAAMSFADSIFQRMIFVDCRAIGFQIAGKNDVRGDLVEVGLLLFARHRTGAEHLARRSRCESLVHPIDRQICRLREPLTELDRLVGLFARLAAGVQRQPDHPSDQRFARGQFTKIGPVQFSVSNLIGLQRAGPGLAGVADRDADTDGAEVDSRDAA